MRVQLIGTHYVGMLIWNNGVRAGVRWDGFEGIEDVATDSLSMWLA